MRIHLPESGHSVQNYHLEAMMINFASVQILILSMMIRFFMNVKLVHVWSTNLRCKYLQIAF